MLQIDETANIGSVTVPINIVEMQIVIDFPKPSCDMDIGTMYGSHVTVCIGQLHSITVYNTGLGVGTVLVLSIIVCSFH